MTHSLPKDLANAVVVAKYEYGQSVNEVNCGHMWGFVEVACYDLLSLEQQARRVRVPGDSDTVLGVSEADC